MRTEVRPSFEHLSTQLRADSCLGTPCSTAIHTIAGAIQHIRQQGPPSEMSATWILSAYQQAFQDALAIELNNVFSVARGMAYLEYVTLICNQVPPPSGSARLLYRLSSLIQQADEALMLTMLHTTSVVDDLMRAKLVIYLCVANRVRSVIDEEVFIRQEEELFGTHYLCLRKDDSEPLLRNKLTDRNRHFDITPNDRPFPTVGLEAISPSGQIAVYRKIPENGWL